MTISVWLSNFQGYMNTEELAEKNRQNMLATRARPGFQERNTASMRTPEARKQRSINSKLMMRNPEHKSKLLNALSAYAATPESKAAKSALCKERNAVMNQTQEHRDKMAEVLERLGGPQRLTHARWHVNRGRTSATCPFC
jgi:hypothetical protein